MDDWEALDALVDKVVRDVDAKRRRKAFRVIENEEFDGEKRSAEQGAAPPRSATSPGGKEERRK